MTNLFGVGIHNERLYSEQFVSKIINVELACRLIKLNDDGKEISRKAGLPFVFCIVRIIAAFTWFFTLLGRLQEFVFKGVSFSEQYERVDFLFWACGIGFVVWLPLHICGAKMMFLLRNMLLKTVMPKTFLMGRLLLIILIFMCL